MVKGLEERDAEQVTVNDLVREMEQICGEEVFSTVYTKKRRLGYFGSSIIVTNINGQPNVTFKQNASEILHTFYERPKIKDSDEQKKSIIHTVAKLIKCDIKSIFSTFKLEYPSADFISSLQQHKDFVPEALHMFLTEILEKAYSSLNKLLFRYADREH